MIGQENSRHLVQPIKYKFKTNRGTAFSRASGYLLVLDSSSHWFPLTFSFLLTGRPDHLELGFYGLQLKDSEQKVLVSETAFN